jgi:hypothetical protein
MPKQPNPLPFGTPDSLTSQADTAPTAAKSLREKVAPVAETLNEASARTLAAVAALVTPTPPTADASGRPVAQTANGDLYSDTPEYTAYVLAVRNRDELKAVRSAVQRDVQAAALKVIEAYLNNLPEHSRKYAGENALNLKAALEHDDDAEVARRLRAIQFQLEDCDRTVIWAAQDCERPVSPNAITATDRRHSDHPDFIGRVTRGTVSKAGY